jgi:hypothetical protein
LTLSFAPNAVKPGSYIEVPEHLVYTPEITSAVQMGLLQQTDPDITDPDITMIKPQDPEPQETEDRWDII